MNQKSQKNYNPPLYAFENTLVVGAFLSVTPSSAHAGIKRPSYQRTSLVLFFRSFVSEMVIKENISMTVNRCCSDQNDPINKPDECPVSACATSICINA